MRIKYYFFSVLSLLWAFAVPINVFGQSKLQQFLDSLSSSQSVETRATSTPTDVDLSEFDSDITETVYVRNGINVRFINGTIVKNESLDGPMVKVQDNSMLTIGSGAVVTGPFKLILVDGGSLYCDAGCITLSDTNTKSKTEESPVVFAIQDPCDKLKVTRDCVELTKSDDLFQLSGGFVYDVDGQVGDIQLLGGEMNYIRGKNIKISGGKVITVRDEGNCFLDGGEVDKVYGENVKLSGKSKINEYLYLNGESIAYITGSLTENIVIHTYKKEGESLIKGKDYSITEQDFKKIKAVTWSVNSHIQVGLKIVNNEVVIAEENEIKDAKTLQEALDAVAAKNINPWERETIEIPAEGIEIDKSIYFRKNCRVKLTGGPIKISSDFKTNPAFPYPYYVFLTEKESAVEFENITLDFNNNNIFKSALFEINGMFAIKDKVEFKNIDKNIDLLYGVFYMKDGCHFTYGGISEIQVNPTVFYGEGVQEAYFTGFATSYCKPVVNTQSIFNVIGGKIQSNYSPYSIKCRYLHIGGDTYITSNGETVAEADDIYIDGGYVNGKSLEAESLTITTDGSYNHHFYLDKISVTKNLTLYGKLNIACPVSFENTESVISINQAISCSTKIKFISPCWKDLLKKPLISGTSHYALPDDILDNFDFSKSKYKPVLDKENNCIYLKKKSLNDYLDDLGEGDTGTEENPVNIDLPDEEDVEEDTHFPGDLQGLLDGLADKENDDSTPKSLKLVRGNILMDSGCTITIRNYILDGCSTGKRIYVDGTLIIDANIYIRNFTNYFVYVRKGGRVIWRGGRTELINKVIYNEGGTIIIEGGDINGKGGSAIVNAGGNIEVYEGSSGSTTTISGAIDNGDRQNGGTIHFYGGSYDGHITNYGTLVISGGNYSSGSSSTTITNYDELHIDGGTVEGYTYSWNDFHLCGCANVGDIYLRGGSTIYVTERLTVKIRIHIFIDGTFSNGGIIAVGTDGYILTEEDLKFIELILPDGYEWEYDTTRHGIIIKSSTGIDGTEKDSNVVNSAVYSLNGVKVGVTAGKKTIHEGIYIIDGKKRVVNSAKK